MHRSWWKSISEYNLICIPDQLNLKKWYRTIEFDIELDLIKLAGIVGPWRKFCALLSLILVYVLLCVFSCLNGEDDKRCHYDEWNHGDGCSLVRPVTFFHNAAFLWLRPECNYRQNKTDRLQILNTTVSFLCAGFEMFNWLHTDMFVDPFDCFWCECQKYRL